MTRNIGMVALFNDNAAAYAGYIAFQAASTKLLKSCQVLQYDVIVR